MEQAPPEREPKQVVRWAAAKVQNPREDQETGEVSVKEEEPEPATGTGTEASSFRNIDVPGGTISVVPSYGERRTIGSPTDCGSVCCGFESRRSPIEAIR